MSKDKPDLVLMLSLAENIRRSLRGQAEVAHGAMIMSRGQQLDFLNHMDTMAQQLQLEIEKNLPEFLHGKQKEVLYVGE